ncbi:hypothetical protein SPI_07771 [Niveomyces insectorum RCEF 264]|uniref:Uncharacterized protein n=1 Tax=Niveomyces insectorum RCEF 264 TaxID=1081102 RepID=A0A162MHL1_9HYPO|nr:hypothetical protein SPI_07771 [Niveomyces insectorum RCEF 264]
MLASASSVDSTSSSSSTPSRHPKGNVTARSGALALVHFVFYRFARSGPKLLLYLALLLSASFIIIKCLPIGLSDSLASSTSHLWTFRPGGGSDLPKLPPGENNAEDALIGGGLRIVVFGENDVATSMLQGVPDGIGLGASNGISWTKELCIELGCTTYLSYVPPLTLPQRSLSSNALYAGVLQDVLDDSQNKSAADDFSYLSSAYPVRWEARDLNAQVTTFLGQPAPQRPPKETIWVASFGMWDVWSLAAFPYAAAEGILVSIIADIFFNVERLYEAAHDARSIAYSNRSFARSGAVAANANAHRNASGGKDRGNSADVSRRSGAGIAQLPWDDDTSEPFRVMVPLLFDPSLVPGWHVSRPESPLLHTKSEHVRNAVRLTKKWNDAITFEMEAWRRMNVTFVHPAGQPEVNRQTGTDAGPGSDVTDGGTSRDDSKGNSKGVSKRSRDSSDGYDGDDDDTSATALDADTGNAIIQEPMLYRDGIIFQLPDYIMDAIIDGQMQNLGIADKKGFGTFSNSESFSEVRNPCLTDGETATTLPTTEMKPENKAGGEAEAEASKEAASSTNGNNSSDHVVRRQAPGQNTTLRVCDRPDRHLFFTPFSLGRRAIEGIGRLAAAFLRADRNTRASWEEARKSIFESDRPPASWKNDYLS